MPVLTIEGGSFPNRVAASLYASFDAPTSAWDSSGRLDSCSAGITERKPNNNNDAKKNINDMNEDEDRLPSLYTLSNFLVGYSQKEFEDMAIRLMSNRDTLRRLKNELSFEAEKLMGIFDSDMHAFNFIHGMESIAEIKSLYSDVNVNLLVNNPLLKQQQSLPHISFTNVMMDTSINDDISNYNNQLIERG